MNRLKLSYHTFGFGSPFSWVPAYPLRRALEHISSAGYEGAELGAARPHAWPPDLTAQEIRFIRRDVRSLGLELCAMTPCTHNLNVASEQTAESREARMHYTECITLAAELEIPTLVYVPGWRMEGTSLVEGWGRSASALSELAAVAERCGVQLAVEPINHQRVNIVNNVADAVRLIREVNAPNVKLMVDTAHMVVEGDDPAAVVCEHSDLLVHVHCSDSVAESYVRSAPGEGAFSYGSFISALLQTGYSGYLSTEIWGPDPQALAVESYRFLRQMEAEHLARSSEFTGKGS